MAKAKKRKKRQPRPISVAEVKRMHGRLRKAEKAMLELNATIKTLRTSLCSAAFMRAKA